MDNKLSYNKLSDSNLASELVENRNFKPITIEEIVIFMIYHVIFMIYRDFFFSFSARSDDSCPSAPISKNQTLPPGCVLNGTNITILDVGECERVACVKRKDAFNSSCSEPLQCCGPRSFDNVLVRCGAFMSFTLSKIKACGCDQCIDEQTIMEGVTVGQDGKAAKFVDLFF